VDSSKSALSCELDFIVAGYVATGMNRRQGGGLKRKDVYGCNIKYI
jgi:hypothetical protein